MQTLLTHKNTWQSEHIQTPSLGYFFIVINSMQDKPRTNQDADGR